MALRAVEGGLRLSTAKLPGAGASGIEPVGLSPVERPGGKTMLAVTALVLGLMVLVGGAMYRRDHEPALGRQSLPMPVP
jgi:hypothetical protein